MPDADDVFRFNARQNRYQLEAPIGRGGMSTVFRGYDRALDRSVAIKLFRTSAASDQELRAQQQEARLLASFAHHSLVRLFDVGVDFQPDGAPRIFLVMELIDGVDLRVRLGQGPLPLLHVAHIAYDLAEGLAYLHANGVSHRDVKPANVLLVHGSEGRRPRVKLADLGIAELEDHAATVAEETTGTAAYLSPEQAAGEEVTRSSDVYALGLVILEAITRRTEFPGGIVQSAFARLDRDPTIPDQLPPAWAGILSAMTRRDPQQRPSAVDTAEAFRRILVDEFRPLTDEAASSAISRLAAVRRYNVLAPGPDPELHRLALLAARLTTTDEALIAIADEDRTFIRAHAGTAATLRRSASDATAGQYVDGALEQEPVDILDLAALPAPERPPLGRAMTGSGAYASVPIRTHDGHAIGVVAVLTHSGHHFSDDDRSTLQDIAEMAMHEIELRRAVRRTLLPGRSRFAGP